MDRPIGIIPYSQENKVNLVSYGAVAMKTYGNKKIPILVADTSSRPDIKEMILIHQSMPPGDCVTQWSVERMNKKFLVLSFKFERPSRISFYIPLYFHEHSWVIEGIIQAQAVFLKSAPAEETTEEMLTDLEHAISVEIGASTKIHKNWRKWQIKAIRKHLKSNGLSKKEVVSKTNELILSNTKFWAEHVAF